MRTRDWNRLVAGLALVAPVAHVARAEVYLTVDQAGAALFPGVPLKSGVAELTPADMAAIEKSSGERVPTPHIRAWWGPNGEAMIVDAVIGKHDYITYATGINADGTVRGVEILDYRENYGYQVRDASWRRQFVGKSSKDPIRVNKDIANISGATLSSTHVTNGVRRVLQTYDVLRRQHG